jgi:hypothetical protein
MILNLFLQTLFMLLKFILKGNYLLSSKMGKIKISGTTLFYVTYSILNEKGSCGEMKSKLKGILINEDTLVELLVDLIKDKILKQSFLYFEDIPYCTYIHQFQNHLHDSENKP